MDPQTGIEDMTLILLKKILVQFLPTLSSFFGMETQRILFFVGKAACMLQLRERDRCLLSSKSLYRIRPCDTPQTI